METTREAILEMLRQAFILKDIELRLKAYALWKANRTAS